MSKKVYTVFVGGTEVSDHYLTKEDAKILAQSYIDDGYTDVKIVNTEEDKK